MYIVLPFFFTLALQNVMNIFATVASYEYLISDVTVSNRVTIPLRNRDCYCIIRVRQIKTRGVS